MESRPLLLLYLTSKKNASFLSSPPYTDRPKDFSSSLALKHNFRAWLFAFLLNIQRYCAISMSLMNN